MGGGVLHNGISPVRCGSRARERAHRISAFADINQRMRKEEWRGRKRGRGQVRGAEVSRIEGAHTHTLIQINRIVLLYCHSNLSLFLVLAVISI